MNQQLFPGLYLGTVESNDDPLGLMRIQTSIPEVFGAEDLMWALACVPPGVKTVPDKGDLVWIMFKGGDSQYPVWMGVTQKAT